MTLATLKRISHVLYNVNVRFDSIGLQCSALSGWHRTRLELISQALRFLNDFSIPILHPLRWGCTSLSGSISVFQPIFSHIPNTLHLKLLLPMRCNYLSGCLVHPPSCSTAPHFMYPGTRNNTSWLFLVNDAPHINAMNNMLPKSVHFISSSISYTSLRIPAGNHRRVNF